MDKSKVQKCLNKAYEYISKLQVSGDAVDLVALVRAELREAWKEMEKETEGDTDEDADSSVRKRDPEDAAAAI